MYNMPDDINNYICPSCKELTPNCICKELLEEEVNSLYNEALYGSDTETYYSMFDSIGSDDVVELLREYHRGQTDKAAKQLIAQLDLMLNNHVQAIIHDGE